VFKQINESIQNEGLFQSGDISLRNIKKFSALTHKHQGLMESIGGPFGHTALIDNSAGALKFSELNFKYKNSKIEVEAMLTHDRFRLDLSKALTNDGRKLLLSLATSKDQEDIRYSEKPLEVQISEILQEELQTAVDNLTIPVGNEALSIERAQLIENLKIPLKTWESIESLQSWVTEYNTKEQLDEPITINQLLIPNPSNINSKIEKMKLTLCAQEQQKKYSKLTNSSNLQNQKYLLSYITPFDISSKIQRENILLEGKMICSQFAISTLLKASAEVEKRLKTKFLELNPHEKDRIENMSLFKFSNLGKLTLSAMTPEVIIKKFKRYLSPIKAPTIFKELIDAPKDFFEPEPILPKRKWFSRLR